MHKHCPRQDHICVPTARYPAWQDTSVQLLKTNLWQQQEAVMGSLPQPVLVVFQSWGWEVVAPLKRCQQGEFSYPTGRVCTSGCVVYGSHQHCCTARTPRNGSAGNTNISRPSTKRGRNTHEIGVNCVVLALHDTDSFLPFWQATSGKTALTDGWCWRQSWQRYSKRDHTCF